MAHSVAEYARIDPAMAIASLFRPVTRGRRPRALELITEHSGAKVTWRSFEYLDSRDQSILYAICALAAMEYAGDLDADSSVPVGQALWSALKADGDAKSDTAAAFSTSSYRILTAAGMPDKGQSYEKLNEILSRLSDVSIRIQRDGYDWKMHLLSYRSNPDGGVYIALNGRLAAALVEQHIRINLEERRSLGHTDTDLICHSWLSAWIRPGRVQRIGLDKLAAQVWGGSSKNASTTRNRRERVAKALKNLNKLDNWNISVTGRGKSAMAHIQRAKTPT